MSRFFAVIAALWALSGVAAAQDFGALARIDAAQSRISDADGGGLRIALAFSQGVPWRVFTLDGPPRLVLDFRELDWAGLDPATFAGSARIAQIRFGTYLPGWSRMVAELAAPVAVAEAGLEVDATTGAARLSLRLTPTDAATFAAAAGAPYDPRWDLPAPAEIPAPAARGPDAPLRVVIDPGHGGIDPGAETDGVNEKTLMLTFARELRETLLRSGGFEVTLTRDDDYFVSLERRISLSRQAGADVFVSLHADTLSDGLARGATVHVLAREASDIASAKLAERHDRGDLLSGVDLSAADDLLTGILLDLARQETQPRTEALARELVSGMAQTGGPMNSRPLRRAAFSVLKAADIPSVLIEVGFLSSPRDLNNLRNPDWRAGMARGIRNGLRAWRRADRAQRPLVRQ